MDRPIVTSCRTHFFDLYQSWEGKQLGTKTPNRFFAINSEDGVKLKTFNNYPELVENIKAKVLFTNPDDLSRPNPISRKLCRMIEKAQIDIKIAHMMFNPCDEIEFALKKLKLTKPQVEVTLISNGITDRSPFANHTFVETNRKNYDLVDQVFEFIIPETLYHKKITTVDHRYTVIGSYNYSYKSAFLDNEVALVIDSVEFTSMVNCYLGEDYGLSKRILGQEKDEIQSSLKNYVFAELQTSTTAHFF